MKVSIIIEDLDLSFDQLKDLVTQLENVNVTAQKTEAPTPQPVKAETLADKAEKYLPEIDGLEGDEQTKKAAELHYEKGVSWRAIGDHIGVRADTLYRRVKAIKNAPKKAAKKAKKKAKAAKPKPAPKPKKPSVPDLSDEDLGDALYAVMKGNTKGVHFSHTMAENLIAGYTEKYENDGKLDTFKREIHQRIVMMMNKIALVLGPSQCIVTHSREGPGGQHSHQLMVYSSDLPPYKTVWSKLLKLGLGA